MSGPSVVSIYPFCNNLPPCYPANRSIGWITFPVDTSARRLLVTDLVLSSAVQPILHAQDNIELDTHRDQVRCDESHDLPQAFQVASLAAGHMGDMTAPHPTAVALGRFFEPDLDDEGMGVEFKQVHINPVYELIRGDLAQPLALSHYMYNNVESFEASWERLSQRLGVQRCVERRLFFSFSPLPLK